MRIISIVTAVLIGISGALAAVTENSNYNGTYQSAMFPSIAAYPDKLPF